jgi:cell wall-associated NlpC family hydrolase
VRKAKWDQTNQTALRRKRKTVEVVEQPEEDPASNENYFARQIVNNALQFEGVRYRGGGTTTAGMDCSGMVYATFKMFDWTLPRSSALWQMVQVVR